MTSTAFAIFTTFLRPDCENRHTPFFGVRWTQLRNLQMGRLEGGERGEGGLDSYLYKLHFPTPTSYGSPYVIQ